MCAFPNYQANLDRRAVSRALRAWRREADDMTCTALAAAGGWSVARMSMILNAVSPVSDADLVSIAMILKADPAQRELAYNSLQRARSPRELDGRPCLGWGLDELEAEATELRMVAGELLPPLLQSQAYAGAVHAAQAAVTCLSFLERQFEDVVAAELPHGTTWFEHEAERVPYEHRFLKLQEIALPEAESVEFVADVMDCLRA